jgi:alpha-ketoglutarate-dependent taurine dioxygenase
VCHPTNLATLSLLSAHSIVLQDLQRLGSEVSGFDLKLPVHERVVAALQNTMARRGFLVVRGQGVLCAEEQIVASTLWGSRAMHSTHR